MRVKNKTKTRLALPHFIWSQIGAFCLSAAASGCMFVRWWRLDEEGRQGVWWLYGVFTAFMCVGSVVGAAAWCFQTLTIASFFIFSKNPLHSSQSNQLSSLATIQTYSALFLFLYPLEVFCLSTVKLAVLDRMQDFCAAPGCGRDKRMWRTAARAAMALVSAGCVVGLFGGIAAGVYRLQAASFFANAAASAASNASFADLAEQGSQRIQLAVEVQSVQNFAEMATLLLIVAVFVIVGVMCSRRITSSLELTTGTAHAAIVDKAKHLRRQIFSTAAVVFVTFLLRAAFESFNAVSAFLQNLNEPGCHINELCSDSSTMECPFPYNPYAHMQLFLYFTPEFQMIVVLISSPLALLVAFWNMTNGRTLQALTRNRQHMQPMLRDEA